MTYHSDRKWTPDIEALKELSAELEDRYDYAPDGTGPWEGIGTQLVALNQTINWLENKIRKGGSDA